MRGFESRLKKAEEKAFGSSKRFHVIRVAYGEDKEKALQKYEEENNVKVGPDDLEVFLMSFAAPDRSFDEIAPPREEKSIAPKQVGSARAKIDGLEAEIAGLIDELEAEGLGTEEIAKEIYKDPNTPVQEQEEYSRPEISELTRLMRGR